MSWARQAACTMSPNVSAVILELHNRPAIVDPTIVPKDLPTEATSILWVNLG